jgi:hypothetical protein
MLEAVSTSETSVKSTRLHGATSQKTAIFMDEWSFISDRGTVGTVSFSGEGGGGSSQLPPSEYRELLPGDKAVGQ